MVTNRTWSLAPHFNKDTLNKGPVVKLKGLWASSLTRSLTFVSCFCGPLKSGADQAQIFDRRQELHYEVVEYQHQVGTEELHVRTKHELPEPSAIFPV